MVHKSITSSLRDCIIKMTHSVPDWKTQWVSDNYKGNTVQNKEKWNEKDTLVFRVYIF